MAANFEGNRWYTRDNEIIATYFGWVAIIKSTKLIIGEKTDV